MTTTTTPAPAFGRTETARVGSAREPGQALLDEARTALRCRRWNEAKRILVSARRLRPDDFEVRDLLLVAAAEDGDRSLVQELSTELGADPERPASSNDALAVAALRRKRFLEADRHARDAVRRDPDSPDAWAHLAAGYAGLGWFGQAHECLYRAEAAGGANPEARWRVGRAINHWGLSDTPALWVGIVTFLLLGPLAAGIGLTVPFLFRELRVARLDPELAGLAELAWRGEHRLRLLVALAVLASILTWLLQLRLAAA